MTAFFFGTESPKPLAFLRICLGFILCYEAAVHWPYAIELYSSAGSSLPVFADPGWNVAPLSPELAVLLCSLWVFTGACVCLGWFTRWNLLLSFGLLFYLGILDGPGTFKKYSVISLHLLFLLSFSRCGSIWSLDAKFSPRQDDQPQLSPLWPKRLIQLMLCSVYWGAAVTKLKLPGYGTGELLVFSLLDPRWSGTWLGFWLATHHQFMIFASWGTVFFEFLFPVLIWLPRFRRPLLLLAFLFHLSLAFTLSLNIFTPIMWAALCSFLIDQDFEQFGNRFRRNLTTRRKSLAKGQTGLSGKRWLIHAGLYGVCLVVVSGSGYLIQRQVDWYGAFNSERKFTFRKLTTDEANAYLYSPEWPLSDYLHRIEVGSRVGVSHLFGSSTEFQQGEILYVLLRVLNPHPELELKVRLTDPDGDDFEFPETVEIGAAYKLIQVQMTADHIPGKYRLELFAVNHEAFFASDEELLKHSFFLRAAP